MLVGAEDFPGYQACITHDVEPPGGEVYADYRIWRACGAGKLMLAR